MAGAAGFWSLSSIVGKLAGFGVLRSVLRSVASVEGNEPQHGGFLVSGDEAGKLERSAGGCGESFLIRKSLPGAGFGLFHHSTGNGALRSAGVCQQVVSLPGSGVGQRVLVSGVNHREIGNGRRAAVIGNWGRVRGSGNRQRVLS